MSTRSVAPLELDDLFDGYERPALETLDWQGVAHVDLGGGYDWRRFIVFYSPSEGHFFWASGGGCSCNTLAQDLHRVGDFVDGDRASAIANANRFCDEAAEDQDRNYAPTSVALSQAIASFRPEETS